MHVCVHMYVYIVKGQRTTCRSRLFLSTKEGPEEQTLLIRFACVAFAHRAIFSSLAFYYSKDTFWVSVGRTHIHMRKLYQGT